MLNILTIGERYVQLPPTIFHETRDITANICRLLIQSYHGLLSSWRRVTWRTRSMWPARCLHGYGLLQESASSVMCSCNWQAGGWAYSCQWSRYEQGVGINRIEACLNSNIHHYSLPEQSRFRGSHILVVATSQQFQLMGDYFAATTIHDSKIRNSTPSPFPLLHTTNPDCLHIAHV